MYLHLYLHFLFFFCCKESQSWSRTTKGERPSLENSQSVGKWSATLARKRKLSENRPTLRLNLDQDGFAALAQSNIIIKNHFEREITLQNAPCVITSLEFVAHHNQNSQCGILKHVSFCFNRIKKVWQGLEIFWQNVICACVSLRIVGHEEDKLQVDDSGSISFQSLPRTFLSFPSLLCSFYSAVGIGYITHFPRYISQKTPLCDNGLFQWKNMETGSETWNTVGARNRFA